ncbi:MAG: endonuclease [Burkholderiales bacterium RIFCSPLOWO2_12_FULL_61_40]|nr:MAG: endonuclease [Burkholderiales bacterium RIFCSPLOWO2_12_FULL_61_40]
MHVPRKRRPEFEEARCYTYPQHLRDHLDDLPMAPGVYIFHAEEGDLPLYIGKSVNLRHRVLSHLRNEDEARMLRQTRRISHIRTAGEVGALLLEASMIKQLQPLFNQKLRRTRQLCAWSLQGGVPELVYSKDVNFATHAGLYGLYASRHAALDALRALADQHQLCYGQLGLEKRIPHKPCFRAMLHQCAGVCCARESLQDHQARLLGSLEALQVHCWPYPGAVGLIERHEDLYQMHVIHHWSYLGSVDDPAQAQTLARQAVGFDADGYKILCRPVLGGIAEIVPLW